MITMAFFNADQACLVIDVWGHALHYQVRFDAGDLVEHDDDIIRSAAEVWVRGQDTKALTTADLRLLQEAQQRLLAQVRASK